MLKQIPLTCSGHSRPVVNLSFSDAANDGLYFLFSASKDGLPMLRQGDTGDWIGTFMGHKGAVWGCALNSDATRAATASADFCAKYWNAITGDVMHSFSLPYIVRAVDLDKKGEHMILASKGNCYLHDMNRTDAAPFSWEAHTSSVKRCAYVDDSSNCALTAGDDNRIRLWDLRQPCSSYIREIDLDGAVFGDFSFQNSWPRAGSPCIVTVACGREVQFYDSNLTLIKCFNAPTSVYSAALSPDGESFVFGGEDFKIYRHRFDDCKEIENCKGHFGPVHCVRFAPDGELYASGSEDGTIRLWQTHLGKDYGLWKVDRSVTASPPVGGVVFSTTESPHVITVGPGAPAASAPIVITPKTPTSPMMPK